MNCPYPNFREHFILQFSNTLKILLAKPNTKILQTIASITLRLRLVAFFEKQRGLS
jgi:hypothetical protein